jgi:hypothetical protein
MRWSDPDLELLKSKKIIFKQLADLNKKYVELAQQLQNSYICYLCHNPPHDPPASTNNNNTEGQLKAEQETLVRDKLKSLEQTLSKVKK